MKLSLLLFAVAMLSLSGCSTPPSLPPGSYAELGADYSKDAGVTAHGDVHIPLDRPLPKPKGFAK